MYVKQLIVWLSIVSFMKLAMAARSQVFCDFGCRLDWHIREIQIKTRGSEVQKIGPKLQLQNTTLDSRVTVS